MGLQVLSEAEVQDLLRKVRSLSDGAAKQALLGVAMAFRHVASLKNGFFCEIVNDAVFLSALEKGGHHEG